MAGTASSTFWHDLVRVHDNLTPCVTGDRGVVGGTRFAGGRTTSELQSNDLSRDWERRKGRDVRRAQSRSLQDAVLLSLHFGTGFAIYQVGLLVLTSSIHLHHQGSSTGSCPHLTDKHRSQLTSSVLSSPTTPTLPGPPPSLPWIPATGIQAGGPSDSNRAGGFQSRPSCPVPTWPPAPTSERTSLVS